ncbi:NUDIX domain-containing protein [Brevirhabdus sp.]|uniref:NUDIX domain-containing protein n=1 Tax=Brevirhabdus sp. TaxID=2004514 RepID=UPI00405938F1
MSIKPPRVAVRAVILHEARLLLVNAFPGTQSDLWCAPGGGVHSHSALPDNLRREVAEETGLQIAVGAPCLVNEFHAPEMKFHQIDIYFRCDIVSGRLSDDWRDPEGIVTRRQFFSRDQMASIRVKPDSLAQVAWDARGDAPAILYDPLEPLLR